MALDGARGYVPYIDSIGQRSESLAIWTPRHQVDWPRHQVIAFAAYGPAKRRNFCFLHIPDWYWRGHPLKSCREKLLVITPAYVSHIEAKQRPIAGQVSSIEQLAMSQIKSLPSITTAAFDPSLFQSAPLTSAGQANCPWLTISPVVALMFSRVPLLCRLTIESLDSHLSATTWCD